MQAARQIAEEKGLSLEQVIETIEAALAAAYRKDFGEKNQNIRVKFNMEDGTSEVFDVKTVVEDLPEEELAELRAREQAEAEIERLRAEGKPIPKPEPKKEDRDEKPKDADAAQGEKREEEEGEEKMFNPKTDIQVSEAQDLKKGAEVGEEIWTELDVPEEYGRMAAQTAKQVIVQKLREAERETVYEEYKDREHEIVIGTITRREGRNFLVDLGRATGILPPEEQIPRERYEPGQRYKFYISTVNITPKGPQIVLSRSHEEIVTQLFATEIPEIAAGTVEIKSVAREAGFRTKIAVLSHDESVDPIGACVGQRGSRVQTIINELGGEKVDIIEYEEDPVSFIANSLSPAKIISIDLEEDEKTAKAEVDEDQLSLAIGRSGQNVRLASKLTGWKIDILRDDVPARDESDDGSVENEGDKDQDDKDGAQGAGDKDEKEEKDAQVRAEEEEGEGADDDSGDEEVMEEKEEKAGEKEDDADEKEEKDDAEDEAAKDESEDDTDEEEHKD